MKIYTNILVKVDDNDIVDGTVTLPEGVCSIAEYAFERCSSLKTISLPQGLTSIGKSAFVSCSSLTTITLPDSVTFIGEEAFSNCSSLETITLPKNVTVIKDSVFSDCSNLKTISFHEKLTCIGKFAFNKCSSLTTVTLPKGVTQIQAAAFGGCSSLKTITIPDSVTIIAQEAFIECVNLESIILPKGVAHIAPDTFHKCSSLSAISIPEGVTFIGERAFIKCSSLKTITLPESLTSIHALAFKECSKLETISINSTEPAIKEKLISLLPADMTAKVVFSSSPFYSKGGLTKETVNSAQKLTEEHRLSQTEKNLDQLLRLIKEISGNKEFWKDKVPNGKKNGKIPDGIKSINSMSSLTDIINKAKQKHSHYLFFLHHLFRGRHQKTNDFYRILSKVNTEDEVSVRCAITTLEAFHQSVIKFPDKPPDSVATSL